MKQLRLVCVLGKFRVVDITHGKAKIQLGGTTTAIMDVPPHADLRLGDLLTFYTEIPYKDPTDALTQPASVQ